MPPLIDRLMVRPRVRGGIVPSSVRDGLVGEEDTCRVIVDGAAVQQLPRFAVGVDRPTADNPRVEEVEALVARPIDLPVRLADEHGLALVDGNLRWTNLNLERHDVRLTVVRRATAGAAEIRRNDKPPNHKLLRPQLGPLN